MVSKSVIGFTLVPEALETLNPNGSSAREPFFCFASPRPVATIVTFKSPASMDLSMATPGINKAPSEEN